MKKKTSLYKLTLAALFAAVICVATMVAIPSPTSNGYLNVGDCFVILAAWLLSPVSGMLAAGIGAALSDLILGYAYYAPGTLIIKILMAFVCGLVYRSMRGADSKKSALLPCLTSGVLAEIIMIAGYFLYDSVILGNAVSAALAGVPGNCAQGVVGVIGSFAIMLALEKTKVTKKLNI